MSTQWQRVEPPPGGERCKSPMRACARMGPARCLGWASGQTSRGRLGRRA
eukprot:CAMPEP_0176251342 /NCGR_PEP_ID=MMETSP0121_2-20121125/34950_1 /TAXON_ID=160619 /ORGANISM="Kryptoperidinium foliaceum, Strain CCMP 1326" /LENGTH=49 /DNA_ID= /DNA_START= /DNA_END= /DNA_ORIENTATION=